MQIKRGYQKTALNMASKRGVHATFYKVDKKDRRVPFTKKWIDNLISIGQLQSIIDDGYCPRFQEDETRIEESEKRTNIKLERPKYYYDWIKARSAQTQ